MAHPEVVGQTSAGCPFFCPKSKLRALSQPGMLINICALQGRAMPSPCRSPKYPKPPRTPQIPEKSLFYRQSHNPHIYTFIRFPFSSLSPRFSLFPSFFLFSSCFSFPSQFFLSFLPIFLLQFSLAGNSQGVQAGNLE